MSSIYSVTIQKKNSKGYELPFKYDARPILCFTEPGLYLISSSQFHSPLLLDVQYLDLKEDAVDVDKAIELMQRERNMCMPYEEDIHGVMTPRWNNVTPL